MKNSAIFTKKGTLSRFYINALLNSTFSNCKIYTKFYRGSGRHISLSDSTFYIIQLLKAKGYKYTEENDAPRGGKNGDYIKVSSTAHRYLLSLIER